MARWLRYRRLTRLLGDIGKKRCYLQACKCHFVRSVKYERRPSIRSIFFLISKTDRTVFTISQLRRLQTPPNEAARAARKRNDLLRRPLASRPASDAKAGHYCLLRSPKPSEELTCISIKEGTQRNKMKAANEVRAPVRP